MALNVAVLSCLDINESFATSSPKAFVGRSPLLFGHQLPEGERATWLITRRSPLLFGHQPVKKATGSQCKFNIANGLPILIFVISVF